MKKTIKEYLNTYLNNYIFIYKDNKIAVEGFRDHRNKWIFKTLTGLKVGLFRRINILNKIVLDDPEEKILLVI